MITKYFSDHPCYGLEFSQDTLESLLKERGTKDSHLGDWFRHEKDQGVY